MLPFTISFSITRDIDKLLRDTRKMTLNLLVEVPLFLYGTGRFPHGWFNLPAL